MAAGDILQLSINDAATPQNPDYTASQIVQPADWDPSQTYAEFNLLGTFDIKPGFEVTLTNGRTVKFHIVRALAITGYNLAANTVTGTAGPNSTVDARVCEHCAQWIYRHVKADGAGLWTADFAHPGPGADEKEVFDIIPDSLLDRSSGMLMVISPISAYASPMCPVALVLALQRSAKTVRRIRLLERSRHWVESLPSDIACLIRFQPVFTLTTLHSTLIAGAIKLTPSAMFDYEVKSRYSICLQAVDAKGHSFHRSLAISISDLPETFLSVGAQDGWILESSESSGLGAAANAAGGSFNLGDDASRKRYRVILSFNTAPLPDTAVITDISLSLKRHSSPVAGSCHRGIQVSSSSHNGLHTGGNVKHRILYPRHFTAFLSTLILLTLILIPGQSSPVLAQGTGETRTYDIQKIVPHVFNGDVRNLPSVSSKPKIELDLKEPQVSKPFIASQGPAVPNLILAPMPAPSHNFAGLTSTDSCTGGQCGAGIPPDPNGDVGPSHYIQAVNSAFAIYNKAGTLLASFTEDSLWSTSVPGGGACNGNSQGDPVVIYDALANRWILTNFAFAFDLSGNPVSPFYQCLAVSKTSDPVSGGWYLYAIRTDTGSTGQPPLNTINDYPKFGIWTDCLYFSANGFLMPAETFNGGEFGSFSRSDMYAGLPLTGSLGFAASTTDFFTMIPSNLSAPGAAGVPPAGTPNYFVQESGTAFNYRVRKFTAGTNCGAGTLSAVTIVSQTSYTFPNSNIVPQPSPATASNLLELVGRPHDAKSSISQGRRQGVAVGRAHLPQFGQRPHRDAMGADQCHRQGHRNYAGPAAAL